MTAMRFGDPTPVQGSAIFRSYGDGIVTMSDTRSAGLPCRIGDTIRVNRAQATCEKFLDTEPRRKLLGQQSFASNEIPRRTSDTYIPR